jgi:hypothetical protein
MQRFGLRVLPGHDKQATQLPITPSATVRLVRVDTDSVYTAATNAEGLYTIPSVPIGTYTLEATVAGFKPARSPESSFAWAMLSKSAFR